MYMVIRKGHVPPLEAIKAATKENREAFGQAIASENQIIIEQGLLPWAEHFDEDIHAHILSIAETFKNDAVAFWFSDQIVKTEQPFTMFEAEVEGKNTIQAVVFTDGDWTPHDDEDSQESPDFLAFENFIKPRSIDLVGRAEVNGDIDKFREFLTAKGNEKNMDNFLLGDVNENSFLSKTAIFGIYFSDGLNLNMGGTESVNQNFPWGYMSDPCGYVEGKKTMTIVPKGAKPAGKNVTDEMDKATGKVVLIQMHPPKSCGTIKEINGWYRTWNYAKDKDGHGLVPENARIRPAVEVDKAKWEADPNFRNVPASAAATAVKPAASVPAVKTAGAKPSVRPSEGVHSITFNQTLTAAQKAALTTGWMNEGFINDAHISTATMGSQESKVPTFAEITGVSLNDLLRHTPTSINFIVEKHPELATNLVVELLSLCEKKQVLSPAAVKAPANAGKPTIKVKAKAAG